MTRIGIAVALALSSTMAVAAEWHYVNKSDSEVYFIDESKLDRQKPVRDFWLKYISKSPEYVNSKQSDRGLIQYRANCRAGEIADLQVIKYTSSGSTAYSAKARVVEFDAVAPETVAESWLTYVCAKAVPQDDLPVEPDVVAKYLLHPADSH